MRRRCLSCVGVAWRASALLQSRHAVRPGDIMLMDATAANSGRRLPASRALRCGCADNQPAEGPPGRPSSCYVTVEPTSRTRVRLTGRFVQFARVCDRRFRSRLEILMSCVACVTTDQQDLKQATRIRTTKASNSHKARHRSANHLTWRTASRHPEDHPLSGTDRPHCRRSAACAIGGDQLPAPTVLISCLRWWP